MTNVPSTRLDPPWPRQARAACAFTFDLDAETLWLARGVEEPVALSQGRYGILEGLPQRIRYRSQQRCRETQQLCQCASFYSFVVLEGLLYKFVRLSWLTLS